MDLRFPAVLAGLLSLVTVNVATADARTDYMIHCMGCHQMDGSGLEPAVPDFEQLARLVGLPGGREYLVRVPGAAQAPLTGARLAAVLNFILARFAPGTDYRAYTPDEVEELRRIPLADPVRHRAELLAAH